MADKFINQFLFFLTILVISMLLITLRARLECYYDEVITIVKALTLLFSYQNYRSHNSQE